MPYGSGQVGTGHRSGTASVHRGQSRTHTHTCASVVLLTVHRRPGMTDAEFAADVAAVEQDLATLGTVLAP